jgi:hypothetical protein
MYHPAQQFMPAQPYHPQQHWQYQQFYQPQPQHYQVSSPGAHQLPHQQQHFMASAPMAHQPYLPTPAVHGGSEDASCRPVAGMPVDRPHAGVIGARGMAVCADVKGAPGLANTLFTVLQKELQDYVVDEKDISMGSGDEKSDGRLRERQETKYSNLLCSLIYFTATDRDGTVHAARGAQVLKRALNSHKLRHFVKNIVPKVDKVQAANKLFENTKVVLNKISKNTTNAARQLRTTMLACIVSCDLDNKEKKMLSRCLLEEGATKMQKARIHKQLKEASKRRADFFEGQREFIWESGRAKRKDSASEDSAAPSPRSGAGGGGMAALAAHGGMASAASASPIATKKTRMEADDADDDDDDDDDDNGDDDDDGAESDCSESSDASDGSSASFESASCGSSSGSAASGESMARASAGSVTSVVAAAARCGADTELHRNVMMYLQQRPGGVRASTSVAQQQQQQQAPLPLNIARFQSIQRTVGIATAVPAGASLVLSNGGSSAAKRKRKVSAPNSSS